MEIQYYTADAFTKERFQGAQIAVIPEASGLDTERMQRIAAEFNLSETVFVFPGEQSVAGKAQNRKVRIFSPHKELGFAGHPIVATAHVLAESGQVTLAEGNTSLRLEQSGGAIEVNISGHLGKPESVQFSLEVAPVVDRFVPTSAELAGILSLKSTDLEKLGDFLPMMVACDQPYLVVPVVSLAALERARFNFDNWSQSAAPAMLAQEIALFCSSAHSRADFHVRLVGPGVAIGQDPPVGAFMPAFAAYLCAHKHVRKGTYPFTVERGNPDTRLSLLDVEMDNKGQEKLTVRIGGPAVTVSKGILYC